MKFKVWDEYKGLYIQEDFLLSKDGEIFFLENNTSGKLILKPAEFQRLLRVDIEDEDEGIKTFCKVSGLVLVALLACCVWVAALGLVYLTKQLINNF